MEKLRDVYLSLILDKRQCLQPEPVSGGPYQKCLKSDVVSSRVRSSHSLCITLAKRDHVLADLSEP